MAGVGDTIKFLNHVLPPTGFFVLVGIKGKQITQQVYESHEAMASAAHRLDAEGYEVFHACAAYKQRRSKRMRVQDNVLAINSVWADLDCGEGKDYPDKKTALKTLNEVCKKLELPLPTIVSSGAGLHVYWVFTQSILNAENAKQFVERAKKTLQQAGLKLDPSRTGDTASVLRPVGTHWKKRQPHREVKLVRLMAPMDKKDFEVALVEPSAVAKPAKPAELDEFALPADYPPADAKAVIKNCAAIRHVAKKKGDVPEPLWFAAIGVLSYTAQGFKAGHTISKGYAGYTYEETQERMERWQSVCSGPATCDKFRAIDASLCEGCEHKVKSPIQLGAAPETAEELPEHTPVSVPVEVVATKTDAPLKAKSETFEDPAMRQIDLDEQLRKKLPENIAYWDKDISKRYRLSGNTVEAAFVAKDEDGEEVINWKPLLNVWLYPYRIRKNSDGERTIELWVRRMVGKEEARRARWEVVQLPGGALSDTNSLLKALGVYGIYEASALDRKVKPMIKQYIQDTIRAMEELRGETDEFDRMGWLPGEEAFVLGDNIISDGTSYPAVVADNALPPHMVTGMQPTGSIERWREVINKVYNRPGAEPYQFAIAAAFAAPLVKLAGIPDFHGIPIALTGVGAAGKTTACMAACSVYGDPLAFYAGGGDAQATTNALLAMVSKVRHLPYLFDEITGRKGEDLQTILYAISNGRPKLRLQRDGKFQESSKLTWDTITYVTSNDKITEVLNRGDSRVVDATQVRVFEIHLTSQMTATLFDDVDPHEIQEVLAGHYGGAGLEYIKYITRKTGEVRKVIETMRRKVSAFDMSAEDIKERFYRELVALTLAGAHIANKLGLLDFDVKALKEWATDHIDRLRRDRVDGIRSAEDVLAKFMADHADQIVQTLKWHTKKVPSTEVARVSDRIRKPVGRVAMDPGKVYIDRQVFDDWLDHTGISKSWFMEEALNKRLLIRPQGSTRHLYHRVVMYKGTDLPMNAMRVAAYEFNPAMVLSATPDLEVVSEEAAV